MSIDPHQEYHNGGSRRQASTGFRDDRGYRNDRNREDRFYEEGPYSDEQNYQQRSSYGYSQQVDRQRPRRESRPDQWGDQRQYGQGPNWQRDDEPQWRRHESRDWGDSGRRSHEESGFGQRRHYSDYDRGYRGQSGGEQSSADWGYRDQDYRDSDYREGSRDYQARNYGGGRSRQYSRHEDEYGYQPYGRRFDEPSRPYRPESTGGTNWQRTSSSSGGFGYGESAASRSERNWQRSSHAGRGPKGYQRSDERITEDINQRLTDDGDIDASEIEVQVKDGEVTLTGTVCDRQCRRDVEDVIESVSGVRDISNQLKTDKSGEQSDSGESGESRSSNGSRKSGSKSPQYSSAGSTGSKSGGNG